MSEEVAVAEIVVGRDVRSVSVPEREAQIGALFGNLNQMEEAGQRIIHWIPAMTDEQISQTMLYAQTLEEVGFKIRGACAVEMRSRISVRVPAQRGRGHTDDAGDGVVAQMAKLAASSHIHPKTLQQDERIYLTFFGEDEESDFSEKRESARAIADTLPREMLKAALGAPDPYEAIQLAAAKRDADPYYGQDQFRRDVAQLKMADARNEPPPPLDETWWLNAPVSQEARRNLVALCEREGKKPGVLLTELLADYAARPPVVEGSLTITLEPAYARTVEAQIEACKEKGYLKHPSLFTPLGYLQLLLRKREEGFVEQGIMAPTFAPK